jgi:hypothetical protein
MEHYPRRYSSPGQKVRVTRHFSMRVGEGPTQVRAGNNVQPNCASRGETAGKGRRYREIVPADSLMRRRFLDVLSERDHAQIYRQDP